MSLTGAKYACIPKLANVQGFWRFEGDFTDLSSNGYTLTETSGTIPFVNGKIERAADFDADDTEYLAIANASCPNLNITGNMSLSALIWCETISADMTVAAKWDGSTSNQKQYRLVVESDSKISFTISKDTANVKTLNSTHTITAGQWYAIAGTFNAATHYIYVYINGFQDGSYDTTYDAIGSDTEQFFIGGDFTAGSAGNYFDGLIDEVLIWNELLTPAEIMKLHSIQLSGKYRNAGEASTGSLWRF